MKEKLEKIIDVCGMIFLCIIIVLLNIFIGSNIKEPIRIIQMLSPMFCIIYVIAKKIISKENIFIKGKIDIFVLLLVISTAIPLVSKTFVSFSNTYNFIMKYVTMYSIYILARNVIISKKRINIILNTIIISSVIVILFAIDYMYFQKLMPIYELLDSVKVKQEARLVGPFGYPNTMALYMVLNLFMAFAFLLKNKKISMRVLYLLYMLLNTICLILTISRSVIILTFFSICFIILFKYRKRINKKYVAIILCCGILFFISIMILIQFSKPLEITEKEEVAYILNLDANTEYEFEFDIYSNSEKNNNFRIEIIEENKYFDEVIIETLEFLSFEGKKNISFTTSEDFYQIKVKFLKNEKDILIVNHLYINGKEYPLKYKYVPQDFAWFFKSLNGKTESVWQRIDFYEDSLSIIKENWLFGAGGNAWKNSYRSIQQYNYGSEECHSYPLELWMSFGLTGIISFFMILLITVKNIYEMIKQKNKELDTILISIIIATTIIILHSFVDFGMSFLIILVLVYLMIAVINQNDKKIKYNFKILDYVLLLVLIIVSFFSIKDYYITNSKLTFEKMLKLDYLSVKFQKNIMVEKQKETKSIKQRQELIETVKRYLELEPKQDYQYKCNIFIKTMIRLLQDDGIEPQKQNVEYIVDLLKNKKSTNKFSFNEMYAKMNSMEILLYNLKDIYEDTKDDKIKEYIENIIDIAVNEFNSNYEIILNYKKNGSTRERCIENAEMYKEKYYKIIKSK